MAIREPLTLVLEFDIVSVAPASPQLALEHVRDVLALRLTNRRRLGDIEIRVDLFLADTGRRYFALRSQSAESLSRFYMGFLRAIAIDFLNLPLLRPPALVAEFRETEEQAREDVEAARERLRDALWAHRTVDLDTNEDLGPEVEEEPDAGADMDVASDGAVTSSTEIGWGRVYGYETSSAPMSTEISIENHADIADLADLEGCLDDSDA
jgi:hypothetical protein